VVGYLLQNHALDAHGFEEWGAVLGEMVRVRLDSRAFSFGKLLCINLSSLSTARRLTAAARYRITRSCFIDRSAILLR